MMAALIDIGFVEMREGISRLTDLDILVLDRDSGQLCSANAKGNRHRRKRPEGKILESNNLELIAISRSPSCRRPAYPEAAFLHRASIDAQQVLTWPFPVVSARKRRQILASSSAWQLSL